MRALAVGDDEEIAATAGGIEETEGGNLLLQVREASAPAPGFVLPGGFKLCRRSSRKRDRTTLRMLRSAV